MTKPHNNQKSQSKEWLYIVPKDTTPLINQPIDNAYLRYHRLIQSDCSKSKVKKPEKHSNISKSLLDRLNQRNYKTAAVFMQKIQFTFTPTTKLMINVGGLSPYSNHASTALHTLYGVPYIPSTAIKGVVRSCFIHEKYKGNEKKAMKDEQFIKCFGLGTDDPNDCGGKGKLIFLDAYPKEIAKLTDDVQTVHYQKYYESEGGMTPNDDRSPVPITYSTIQNMKFTMIMGVLEDSFSMKELESIKKIVTIALTEYGLGAKTSVGYGIGEVSFY